MTEPYFGDPRQQDYNDFDSFRQRNDNDRIGSTRNFNNPNLVPQSPVRIDVKQPSGSKALNPATYAQESHISSDSIRLYITLKKTPETVVDYRKLIIMTRGLLIMRFKN